MNLELVVVFILLDNLYETNRTPKLTFYLTLMLASAYENKLLLRFSYDLNAPSYFIPVPLDDLSLCTANKCVYLFNDKVYDKLVVAPYAQQVLLVTGKYLG